jgi:predicted transcriptional regulator
MVLFIVVIVETFVHVQHKSNINPLDYYKRAILRGVYRILHSSSSCRNLPGRSRSFIGPISFSDGWCRMNTGRFLPRVLHNLDNLLSPSVIWMHIPTPEELRTRREALGLKQTELAKRAGISQSMVARIEAGNVDPRVSTLNKIIVVLNSAEPKKIRAAQIMHTPVLSVQPQDAISRAVDIFEKNNISQLPVIERGVPVGCISEAVIVKAIEQQRLHKTHLFTVRDFMESGFPTVPPDM